MNALTLLLTRPADASTRFAARFKANVVISPLLRIVSTGAQLPENYQDGVIFTSANAVNRAGNGHGRDAFCVGEHTATMAAQAGWHIAQTALTADELVSIMNTPRELVHLCGQHRRGEVAERLNRKGFTVKPLVVYDQQPLNLTKEAHAALSEGVVAPVFSPRTAAILALQDANLSRAHVVAFSPAVAEPLAHKGAASLNILPEPRGELMVRAVENLLLNGTA